MIITPNTCYFSADTIALSDVGGLCYGYIACVSMVFLLVGLQYGWTYSTTNVTYFDTIEGYVN